MLYTKPENTMSLFHMKPDEYPRDLNVIGNYIAAAAMYLSITLKIPYDKSLAEMKRLTAEGMPLEPKNPRMKTLYRPVALADREPKMITLNEYLGKVEKEGLILAPNLVAYENPVVSRAYESKMIDHNLARRSVIKKRGQLAEMREEYAVAIASANEQVNVKTLNNSLSGAAGSPHNPHFCASAHTTLTSTTRILTSNSNSITERFMTGNRHYYSAEITIDNIIACIRLTDPVLIQNVMESFDLAYPTAAYTKGRIAQYRDIYWHSDRGWTEVCILIDSLTPLQLAAVMYTMDLRSWIDCNPAFTRTMFDDLLLDNLLIEPMSVEEASIVLSKADSYIISYVCTLSTIDLNGLPLWDLKDEDPVAFGRIGRRVVEFKHILTGKYWQWCKAFLVTDLMPQSIYAFPTSIRKATIGSDTDSTLFTTQEVIEWYFGGIQFGHKPNGVRELVTYLNSQIVCHILAKLSKYMGVTDENLFRLKMKPEYSFPFMAFTNRMKHYFAMMSAKEGNVFAKLKLEVKGVGMKNSKVPRWVIEISDAYIVFISERFMSRQMLTPIEALAPVAYLEHRAFEDLRRGISTTLYNTKIKEPEAYKLGEDAPPCKYYRLWDEIFGPKYGYMGSYPVECKKVSVALGNKTAIAEWIASINTFDPEMAQRLQTFVKREGRTNFTQFLVPKEFLKSNVIPEEIWLAFDNKKFLKAMMDSFYYTLEVLGIYVRNGKATRYAYQELSYDDAKAALLMDVEKLIPSNLD